MITPLYGLRILVVEDEDPTVQALSYDLNNAFPECTIDVASNVQEGHDRLNAAYDNDHAYDAAILDFKLPPNRKDQNPVPDFSVGRAFRDFMPETVLINVSAHKDDPEIKHYLSHKDAMTEAGRFFVAKEPGWMKCVCEEIVRGLHTRRVRAQFEQLFRRRDRYPVGRVGLRGESVGRSDRGRSLDVAALCADAGQHWEFLTPSLQQDLRNVLGHATDPTGNHLVGVVKAEKEDYEVGDAEGLEL